MIRVEHLTKDYGATRAVDDLSFDVRPGLVTGFLGPNGAGKSTTMRMIAGLDRPTDLRPGAGRRQSDREHTAPIAAYLENKRTEGKARRDAIRCLKRKLSDVVYRQLVADTARPA